MNSAVPRYQGAAASAETARLSHFIDGRFVPAGRSSFENRHPATGEVINLVPEADSAAVDDAVKAAKRALKGPWGRMSEQQRSAILRKVADGIMARFDDFLAAEVLDTGKPKSLASHIDIPRGAANFNVFADQVLTLNRLNPQVASRMVKLFARWRKYDDQRQVLMRAQLERIVGAPDLSPDVFEIASKSLQAA